MASSGSRTKDRESMEEQMEQMRLSDKESAKLVVDDQDEDTGAPSWALLGRVLHPRVLHVNTIPDALRPAWGTPRGLNFDSEVDVELNNMSDQHIDVKVKNVGGDMKEWRFTCFYAKARRSECSQSWDLLKMLRAQSDLPWLCGGDFNEVLDGAEYFGANERTEWQMAGFRETVDQCNFQDLGYNGIPFTWDNRQEGTANVKVRLDRFLADPAFIQMYLDNSVKHIPSPRLDHCFVSIRSRRAGEEQHRGLRRFMYDEAWQREESHEAAVVDGWKKGSGTMGLMSLNEALKDMQVHLTTWKGKKFGDVERKIKKVRKEIKKEKARSLFRGSSPRERDLASQLKELLHREEIMARQRSRSDWLRAGDRNTGFFQAQVKARRSRNRINTLEKADGTLCQTKEEIWEEIQGFYTSLYKTREEVDTQAILHHVPSMVLAQMNERLTRPFQAKEVHVALFAMAPSKAPGEDGFNAGFYQWHWPLIKEDVTEAVLNFLNGGHLPEVMNRTVIVLIPKLKNAHPMYRDGVKNSYQVQQEKSFLSQ
ncbi:uncharacterized protein [Aegilops tauschii subsp. strangulata]|uniref:uncharacterized protein n=1 Tax=Aegilops tauschii subsp. strangulata TaxID=200361 RepID=UPI003CC8E249